MLSTEQNRLRALKTRGDHKEAAQLQKDLQSVYVGIRNDFRDHFSFCPVYYFADTNLALVKQGRLDGILLGADGAIVPAKRLVGKLFQIAYYGYAKANIPRIGYLTEDELADFDTRFGKVWVVYDDQMKQVAYSEAPEFFDRQRGCYFDTTYRRKSKKFNIEYYPIAYKLEEVLRQMEYR
jgi:hypothetical protein